MIEDLRNQTMLLLGDLIGFPTVTSDSNLHLIDYSEDLLRGAGATTSTTYGDEGRKANLLATIGPEVDGGVVLSGHTDVVPAEDEEAWTGAPFLATRRDQRVYGRGAVDMKGFIACCLAMAPVFASSDLRRPVHIALTFDEEIGCLGAPILIEDLLRTGPRPMAAIVGEPTNLRIIEAHKGCYEYTTTISGLEGHGSAPSKAVNAVEYAVKFISRLLEIGRELEAMAPLGTRYDPPHTTISVGSINGGTARNIVAGQCTFEWEMRPVKRSDAEYAALAVGAYEQALISQMRELHPDATIVTETVGAVDGLETVEDSPAVDLAKTLTGETEVDVVSFGTEAGLYQQAGIPAVVCGPGSIDVAHRPDEYVEISQLERCLEMLHRLTETLGED